MRVFSLPSPSNTQVEQAWSFTTVYGEIRRFTCDRITIVYLHVVYGEIRRYTDKKTVVYCLRKRRPYTISVLSRFSPYTIVSLRVRLRRHTIVIRSHVLRQNTVVYDRIFSVYGRIPPFTESVTFDLGHLLLDEIQKKFIDILYN